MEKQPILRAMRINKNFGPTRALIDVDFVLFPGEVHGLIGGKRLRKVNIFQYCSGSAER